MSLDTHLRPNTSLFSLGLGAVIAIVLLVGAFGGWAAVTKINGAIIANGKVEVAGKPKTVQSLDGGVLAELAVKDGDTVSAGDVLVRFDATVLRMDINTARARLADALSLQARLLAETKGAVVIDFDAMPHPDGIKSLDMTGPKAAQQAIFAIRQDLRQGQQDQLDTGNADNLTRVKGVQGQINALEQQLQFLDTDLEQLSGLVAKGLSRHKPLTDMQSARAGLYGALTAARSELARVNHQRLDLSLAFLQNERQFQEEVAVQLRNVVAEVQKLSLSIIKRRAQLDRVDVRAPVDGVVHEIRMTTVGGIVSPGGVLMEIVPQQSAFDFDVRVEPKSINQVHVDQPAKLVLSGFDQQTTPQLIGTVRQISPTIIQDVHTGKPYYRVSLEISPSELARLPKSAQLVPGLPLEAFLVTGSRTVMSYLLSPISTQLRRSFRG